MRYPQLAAMLLSLAGCTGLLNYGQDYSEPQGGAQAKIRISSNGEVRLIPNSNCISYTREGAGLVVSNRFSVSGPPKLQGQSLEMKGKAPEKMKSAEVRVAAGQPLTVAFSSLTPGQASCDYSYTLLPKANEEYQVTVWHDLDAGYCRFEPSSLSNPQQRVVSHQAEQC
ncbi:hypothetical protein [Uliginosibacterium sediminicola]|uniref:Lipoprotein n=1 Tax=Uliginosibacterium sediminicola TaxID=2024550 RepID=A0ABU9Z2J1_9RHOO